MNRSDLPNFITLLRIFLVPPFLYFLQERNYHLALALFLIAGISDGLDGFLAKHYDWTSRLGSILDPIADKFLLVGAFIVLSQIQLIPLWLTVIVLGRDILIILGAIIYHFWISAYEFEPVIISKVNTVIQIILVVAVIFFAEYNSYLVKWLINFIIYLTSATTLFSGIYYIILWSLRAINARILD